MVIKEEDIYVNDNSLKNKKENNQKHVLIKSVRKTILSRKF